MSLLIQSGYVLQFSKASTPLEPQISFHVMDVLIDGNKIVKLEESIPPPPDATVIDARNHIVSPGFIDTHRHLYAFLICLSMNDY